MDRPVTTLFMLMSVDGKISTGVNDELDVDTDFPIIDGLKEGLHQYYEIEQTTDLWAFNTGRVQEKMGVNLKDPPAKSPVSFVILDNPKLKDYDAAKKIAGKKKLAESRSPLEKFYEEDSKRFNETGESIGGNNKEAKIWKKKQEYKRNRKKPKLTHYEKVKKRLQKKTYEKRLKKIEKLQKEQNK